MSKTSMLNQLPKLRKGEIALGAPHVLFAEVQLNKVKFAAVKLNRRTIHMKQILAVIAISSSP